MKKLIKSMKVILFFGSAIAAATGLYIGLATALNKEPYGIVRDIKTQNGFRECLIEWPCYRFKNDVFQYWQTNDTLQIGDTLKRMN